MGIDVALVDCIGEIVEKVGDPHNFLHRLLPELSEDSVTLLSKVDWYGDTYFNHLQMKIFLKEWDDLAKRVRDPEELSLVYAVRQMAVRCQSERQLLRFIGD
jgi:hypothetical protein